MDNIDKLAGLYMGQMTMDDFLLANMVKLARHHRSTCPGSTCNMRLYDLYLLLKKASIPKADDFLEEFI
jgi:hypothetical protein